MRTTAVIPTTQNAVIPTTQNKVRTLTVKMPDGSIDYLGSSLFQQGESAQIADRVVLDPKFHEAALRRCNENERIPITADEAFEVLEVGKTLTEGLTVKRLLNNTIERFRMSRLLFIDGDNAKVGNVLTILPDRLDELNFIRTDPFANIPPSTKFEVLSISDENTTHCYPEQRPGNAVYRAIVAIAKLLHLTR